MNKWAAAVLHNPWWCRRANDFWVTGGEKTWGSKILCNEKHPVRVVDIIRPLSTSVHKCCVSFSQRIMVQARKSRADSHVQDWTFVSMYTNPIDYILWLFDKILWYYVVTTHPACKVILGSPQWANSWVCAAFLILWGNLGKTVISRIADLEKKIGMAFVELHGQLKWKKT